MKAGRVLNLTALTIMARALRVGIGRSRWVLNATALKLCNGSLPLQLCRGNHRIQQPREARFQVIPAQSVDPFLAFAPGCDDSGFTKDPEMMRQGRFGHGYFERAAGKFACGGQFQHDHQPHLVTECMQHLWQSQFVARRQILNGFGQMSTSLLCKTLYRNMLDLARQFDYCRTERYELSRTVYENA